MLKTKAVIFDLYETLITEFTDGIRISNRSYDYMALLGLSNEDFSKEWGSRQQKRMTGEFPNYHSAIQDILLHRNLIYRKEIVDQLFQNRMKEKKIPFQNIRSDIFELLDFLCDHNIKIGLISNCTEEELQSWRGSRLSPYFDDVIFSYEVGMVKPDESIYLLSCSHLGAAPKDTIFVGDGGSEELDGANRAGIRALHACWYNTSVQSEFEKIYNPRDVWKYTLKASLPDLSYRISLIKGWISFVIRKRA